MNIWKASSERTLILEYDVNRYQAQFLRMIWRAEFAKDLEPFVDRFASWLKDLSHPANFAMQKREIMVGYLRAVRGNALEVHYGGYTPLGSPVYYIPGHRGNALVFVRNTLSVEVIGELLPTLAPHTVNQMARPKVTTAYMEDGEKMQRAEWDGKPKRPPKKGEYFLSGAHVTAYRARSDMTTPYFIAVPIPPKEKKVDVKWPGY